MKTAMNRFPLAMTLAVLAAAGAMLTASAANATTYTWTGGNGGTMDHGVGLGPDRRSAQLLGRLRGLLQPRQ